MKIFASSDIHVDFKKNASAFELPKILENSILREKEDCVFVIVGDVAQNLPLFHNFLDSFRHIKIPKLFTAGNHDIWVEPRGLDSFMKYSLSLKEAVHDAGFHYLDFAPFVLGNIGIAGNIGWYDYSFRRNDLPLPEDYRIVRIGEKALTSWNELDTEDYRRKTLYAEINGRLHLITRWNDIVHIRWQMQDEEFVAYCLKKIQKDFDLIQDKVDKILFCSHHIHFRDCVQYRDIPKWDYNLAYYGSEKIGDFLLEQKKLAATIFAHSHVPDARVIRPNLMSYNFPFDYRHPALHSITI